MGARNSNSSSASPACTEGELAHLATSVTSNHSLLFHRFILPNLTNAITQHGVPCMWILLNNVFLIHLSLICICVYCCLVFITWMELTFILFYWRMGLFTVFESSGYVPRHSFIGCCCYRNVLSTYKWDNWILIRIPLWKASKHFPVSSVTLRSHNVMQATQGMFS